MKMTVALPKDASIHTKYCGFSEEGQLHVFSCQNEDNWK